MIKINDIHDSDWNKKIIYAPNSTGKTTVCNQIYNNTKNVSNVELLTAKKIYDLIDLKRTNIYIGKAAKQQGENADIEYELKKNSFVKKIFDIYSVKNATNLRKSSFTFDYYNITNDNIIDLIKKIAFVEQSENKIAIDEALELDKVFKKSDYIFLVEANNNEDIKRVVKNRQKTNIIISQENMDCLKFIRAQISIDSILCPLCGTKYNQNQDLIRAIDDQLAVYTIDDNVIVFDMIDKIYNFFQNSNYDSYFEKYNLLNSDNLTYSQKLFEILKIIELYNQTKETIVSYVIELLKKEQIYDRIKKFKENDIIIENEQKKIIQKEDYYNSIIENYTALINLPHNLSIKLYDNKIMVFNDENKEAVLPSSCLSESEIKRLSLVVLKYQIKYADIEYIIFDDPVDSYDDYFLNRASLFIAEIINSNNNLKWTVFTHIFDCVYLLNDNIDGNYANIFYFHDPSYKYNINEKPKLIKEIIEKKQLKVLFEHETLIFERIFKKQKGYVVNNSFAFLAATNMYRNVIKDILNIYDISFKKSKILKNCKVLENRYLHFSNYGKFFMYELYHLYRKTFKNFNIELAEIDNYNIECIKERENILETDYNNIKCENPLLKNIFYNIIRVSNCKYKMEKYIIESLQKKNISENLISTIFTKNTLGKKLKKALEIEQKLNIECNFSILNEIHQKYSYIINNFSHSTIRMYPPYLSTNSYDIAKLEIEIEQLEGKLYE